MVVIKIISGEYSGTLKYTTLMNNLFHFHFHFLSSWSTTSFTCQRPSKTKTVAVVMIIKLTRDDKMFCNILLSEKLVAVAEVPTAGLAGV